MSARLDGQAIASWPLLMAMPLLAACASQLLAPANSTTALSTVPVCPPGFSLLPGEACLALPDGTTRQMLLYLHGMYDPRNPEQEFAQESLLRERATARGFAVLAPRGRVGLCDWSPDLTNWLCWPTKPDQKRIGGGMLAQWGPAIIEALRRAQVPGVFRPSLLGYSNGGFFATMIAGETRQPLRALAVLHAGLYAGGVLQPGRAIPTLLVAAESDPVQTPQMRDLQVAMEQAGWPSELKLVAGGHALTEESLDLALDFLSAH